MASFLMVDAYRRGAGPLLRGFYHEGAAPLFHWSEDYGEVAG